MIHLAMDRSNGVLLVTFSGFVTVESLTELDGKLKSFVAREGTMPTVIDFSGVESVNVDAPTLTIRGRGRSLVPEQPCVFVASNPLLSGLLLIYAANPDHSGEYPASIVDSLGEAFKLLSLRKPKFEMATMSSEALGSPVYE
jgi:hypothetical protein